MAEASGGHPGVRPGKKDEVRSLDKIEEKNGDASKLNDLCAGKIQYPALPQLYDGLACVQRAARAHGIEIVEMNDRFQAPQRSGYRDVQMFVRMSNGHVGEFRLHLTSIDDIAADEHSLYEVTRDLDTLIDEESRRATLQESAYKEMVNRQLQPRFWSATESVRRFEQVNGQASGDEHR